MHELNTLTAAELTARFADGSATPSGATRASLERIAATDGALNAFVLVDADRALAQAAESDRRWEQHRPLSAVDGVPTAIKDLLYTRGWPTRRGGAWTSDAGPWEQDSPAVASLREAGAVLVGKTTTPDLAWKGVTDSPLTGITRNPYDTRTTPGGSSGGSAAALAAGAVPLSVGTDGGGSVRIPAAFTGTVALKPTFGQVPHYPSSAFGALAHTGPMTRTVTDNALLLDVISRPDDRDPGWMPAPPVPFARQLGRGVAGLRVAFSADLGYVHLDPEVADLVAAAVEVLRNQGATVTAVDPGFDDPIEMFTVLWYAGAAKSTESLTEQQRGALDPGLAEVAAQGSRYSASDWLGANAARMALATRMGRFHHDYDLLVTPSLPIPAFTAGQEVPEGWPQPRWMTWTPFTYPFNLTQQPSLSVPCGLTSAGLPVGLQIVGPRLADATVLAAGAAYEAATGSAFSRPVEPH